MVSINLLTGSPEAEFEFDNCFLIEAYYILEIKAKVSHYIYLQMLMCSSLLILDIFLVYSVHYLKRMKFF